MALAILAVAVIASARTSLHIHRCAKAKEKDPDVLTIVAIVQSLSTEFGRRTKLRQTDFQHAISLAARSVFRHPSKQMGTISTNMKHIQEDKRRVCVQPLFVLAPWLERKGSDDAEKNLRQDEWRRVAAEFHSNGDVLIAPTMVDMHTNAQVLMHVLEWSRQRVPWADYIVSTDTSVNVNWASMIELFPPPSLRTGHASHDLWHLGIKSDPGIDTLFYRGRRAGTWRQCADVGVTAFSRDLVHQITTMPFATQILHALHKPFKMYRFRCSAGKVVNLDSNQTFDTPPKDADLRHLPASINTDSHVRVINENRACEDNNENLSPFFHNGYTPFHLCERLCLLKKNCYAFDYYRKTKYCSFWEQPCKHPHTTKDGASSYEVTTKGCPQAGSGDGMMGILGNPTKYVCNAVQTVLAHLSDASNVTFQTTLVAESDRRFWREASAANDTRLRQKIRHRTMSEKLVVEEGGSAHADNAQAKTRRRMRLNERPSVRKDMHVRARHNEPAETSPQEDEDISTEAPQQGSIRRRVSSVKSYTVPAHPRPGKRCALAKRDLGDDLLTVVAVVPIGPWSFDTRQTMRKYLTPSAHKLRSRRYYRKIVTDKSTRKRARLFKADQAFVQKLFSDSKHESTKHNWGWFKKYVRKPVEDNRAVCVDVIFMVGMTSAPFQVNKWEKLAEEAHEHNDIVILPYLDDRGKGKAMTQKTLGVLWWSSHHLKWADHVFKVDSDTFVNFERLVQVLPPPSSDAPLQWLGRLHVRYLTQGFGPACTNGEFYGFSGSLLQRIGAVIETPEHVEFFLWNPVHLDNRNIDEPLPYSLIAAEDLVACNLVTQVAMGHEDRFEDNVLENPDYYPIWAHKLKSEQLYKACSEGHCRGEPQGRNHMPNF